MKKQIKMILTFAALAILITGCSMGGSKSAQKVSGLSIKSVKVVKNTTDTSKPPLSYTVTVGWTFSDINKSETASESLKSLKAILYEGSNKISSKDLQKDADTFTFNSLKPVETSSLRIEAVYEEGTYPKASWSDYTATTSFRGGPWYTGSNTTAPRIDSGFSVGSFNNKDSMPSGSYSISDYYYFNRYNRNYQFENSGETIWMVVSVSEVTTTNDTSSQRNNVKWLGKKFQLLDASSTGLSSYKDIAKVDLSVVDIYGNELLTMNGATTSATMSSSNFSKLLNSVDSGYYADKTGYYFIKAKCTSMPTSYTIPEGQEEDDIEKYGIWGIANNNPRR